MKYLNVQETASTLTTILDELTTQTKVVIIRDGIPVARIVPWQAKPTSTYHYPLRGMPIMMGASHFFAKPFHPHPKSLSHGGRGT